MNTLPSEVTAKEMLPPSEVLNIVSPVFKLN